MISLKEDSWLAGTIWAAIAWGDRVAAEAVAGIRPEARAVRPAAPARTAAEVRIRSLNLGMV
ncbi:hypothetical protein GCM10010442_52420 [Kitasatospora kifunensis]